MSTKMSGDMVVNRSTTRVHAPPGGASSISFGDEFTALPPAPPKHTEEIEQKTASLSLSEAAPAAVAPAVAAAAAAAAAPPSGTVTVLIAQGKADGDVLAAIVKALAVEGITSPTVVKAGDANVLPYIAQKLGGVVICAAVISASSSSPSSSSGPKSASLEGALLQAGVSAGVYIVPAVIEASSLLEAKVALADKSQSWAQSAKALLHLKADVLPAPIAYTKAVLPPPAPVVTADTLDVPALLEDLRLSLKQHGASGIFGLGRKFRIIDDDNSGSLELGEFTKMVSEHALHWTPAQIKAVFSSFDSDSSASISFTEFLRGVRGPLNPRRRSLVLLAFERLDRDKSGTLETSDLEGLYDASKHPDVISGKKTSAEVLREFLDTFDSPSQKDGKVTTDEFCEYYATLSASIDEDDYFELMIRNAWHISGGEGWCANSSCKRVLATHADGHQTVEEVKDDLGIADSDAAAMLARLVDVQGLATIVSIETAGGIKASVGGAAAAAATAGGGSDRPAAGSAARLETSSFDTVRPSTAPAAVQATVNKKRVGAGESSIVFG